MAAMNMNQEQFKQLIREEKPVLVDFWAPWCSYCRRIGPAYEKIGEEYADSLAVGKINIDEEPQLAGAEGIKVIPTLVLYRNGYSWLRMNKNGWNKIGWKKTTNNFRNCR